MIRLLLLCFIMCYSVGCKTTEKEVVARTENSELKKRYELIVKFASLEDLKRVPYRLSRLKMEIIEDVSSDDNIYLVSILSKDYAIDGTLEKLNQDEGISWAKRAD